MIRKFDDKGNVVEFESVRVTPPGGGNAVDIPMLQTLPEQTYKGEWKPGKNHPTLPKYTTGPLAGITLYVPIPEEDKEQ
jgi:hypothetical protein